MTSLKGPSQGYMGMSPLMLLGDLAVSRQERPSCTTTRGDIETMRKHIPPGSAGSLELCAGIA